MSTYLAYTGLPIGSMCQEAQIDFLNPSLPLGATVFQCMKPSQLHICTKIIEFMNPVSVSHFSLETCHTAGCTHCVSHCILSTCVRMYVCMYIGMCYMYVYTSCYSDSTASLSIVPTPFVYLCLMCCHFHFPLTSSALCMGSFAISCPGCPMHIAEAESGMLSGAWHTGGTALQLLYTHDQLQCHSASETRNCETIVLSPAV